ncbi:MAG: hypothetical protein AAB541_01855 [Patescibacteria group bacterium]
MVHELLERFALDGAWIEEEGGPINDRAGLGDELVTDYNLTPGVFRYLQTLIAGESKFLPYAPPCVKIVVSKDGQKDDFALVYGFPGVKGESPDSPNLATRFPENADMFKVYYGRNYGPGGYDRVETVQVLDPELEARLKAGDFTDEEAEQILAERNRAMSIYWDLNVAARDPQLNPEYAERVNETFYRNADNIGL